MEVLNEHKVPRSQWRKWNWLARHVFNVTYGTMMADQALFSHPMAQRLHREHWKTTSWNAAWIAADAVMGK